MSDAPVQRGLWLRLVLLGLAGVIFVTLVGLGNWQMRRLDEKLALIATVEARAYGEPVPAPATGAGLDYLAVFVTGQFRHDLSLRIKAVTELGPGHWLMTPLVTEDRTLWINRGFVPTGVEDAQIARPQGAQQITGLLRPSQPGGTLLEDNLPDQNRWVSADLPLMSRTKGIAAEATADFYIDAAQTGGGWPRGGMTRLSFRNSHLSYALTWYAMALLFLGGMIYVIRDVRR